MSLETGQTLLHYRIAEKLGEGGMGVVWRATDTKLRRDVALKVLPPALTTDPERLARFEREAQTLAQLHHPGIASIFGLEDADGVRALVMELVEGPTLAERMAHGALPIDEALGLVRQIAEALEAAHEKGIVHRDLKPQNVKLGADGKVKLLDFGLAKALEPRATSGSAPALANSPTLTAAGGTALGMILGTAAYMSPEQAKGQGVDKRADIWAFGVVLWEMLVGRPLFAAESVPETLGLVMLRDPDLGALPAATPPRVRELIARCLERDPKRRLRDIGEARIALDRLAAGALEAATPVPVHGWGSRRLVLAGLALGVAAGALGYWVARASGSGAPAPRAAWQPAFRQLTKLPGGERGPTLSPDGESFIFVKQDGGDFDLFLQRIDGTKAIPLTEDCEKDDLDPAFSPDGRSVAFRSDCGGGVFVMGVTGESKRRVAEFGYGPAWSPDGRELAIVTERLDAPTTRNTTSPLWVVGVESGDRRKVSEHDAMAPTWSSDGRRIAFWGLRLDSFQRDLWSVAADGSEAAPEAARALVEDAAVDWAPVYTKDGRWLYFASTRGGTFNLWRFAVDGHGSPRGAPEPMTTPSSWAGPFSISADGRRIAYCDRNSETAIVRAAFDPEQRALASAPAAVFSGSFELRDQTISGDGAWIVFANEDQPQQLHLVRTDGSGYRQLTTGTDRNRQGALSPDGSHVVFQTTRGDSSLAVVRADGGGWQSLGELRGAGDPVWSPDGSMVGANSTGSSEAGVLIDVRPGFASAVIHALPAPGPGLRFWPGGWSPDGDLVSGRAVGAEGLAGDTGLWVYSLASGAYRELPFRHAGSIDNKQVFVDRFHMAYGAGHEIWLVDVRGGAPVLLYTAPPGHRMDYLSGTRDGRWLTWIDRADESDIWLMTLEDASTSSASARP